MQKDKSKRPHLAVRAIIVDDNGKVLILRRADTTLGGGKWCLPGGNIEYGQTVGEAVALEVHEETSFTAKDVQFLFYLENLPSLESELHYINIVFKCRAEGNIYLNRESSEYAWIDHSDMHNYEFAFKNDLALGQYWHLST
jgi:mutator protein MutT